MDSKKVYETLISKLSSIDQFDKDIFKTMMKEVQKETGFKGKQLWMPYRVGITGRMHGPDISTLSVLFGIEKIKNRLSNLI